MKDMLLECANVAINYANKAENKAKHYVRIAAFWSFILSFIKTESIIKKCETATFFANYWTSQMAQMNEFSKRCMDKYHEFDTIEVEEVEFKA